jgi:hypothetical protein
MKVILIFFSLNMLPKKKKNESEITPTKVVLGVGDFGKGSIVRVHLRL